MRTILPSQIGSSFISLLIQYSLVISFTILPIRNPAVGQAQDKVLPATDPTRPLQPETARSDGPTPFGSVKGIKDDYLQQTWGRKTELNEGASFADTLRGFANSETSSNVDKVFASRLSTEGAGSQPSRPLPTPPLPGIGSGGTGPGGSFNVEPPARLQGAPPGVRGVEEIRNEPRTAPKIPDPIPSTQSYCWPGDPECRKRPATEPKAPAPKPTPPPRPQSAGVVTLRPDLLVAANGRYLEKLLGSAPPFVSYLREFGYLLKPTEPFGLNSATKGLESGVPVTSGPIAPTCRVMPITPS